MKITLAKTAGFCFGVNRAVNMLYDLVADGVNVCTLGPIIHNPQVVADLENKGVNIIDNITDADINKKVVIRTHGVEQNILKYCVDNTLDYIDATCPFVKKIHKIVQKESSVNMPVLIAGDKNHPEVIGIKSYCNGDCFVFNSEDELNEILTKDNFSTEKPFIVVSQTTFSTKVWKKCVKKVKLLCTNAIIFDTICNATEERQAEALKLSKEKRGNCLWIMKDIRIQTTSIRMIIESNLREVGITTADLIIQVLRKETDTAVWTVTV